MWKVAGRRVKVRAAVQQTVASTLLGTYENVKRTPEAFYQELLVKNTTHFAPEELERLLAAFKRVTVDRLQAASFYEVISKEMGWTNLLLRKQLFRAFDLDGHGDINFTEFCEGYSTMLRGTLPQLVDFSWRLFHISGPEDMVTLTDVYTIYRLALAGLEEMRQLQGGAAGGAQDDTRFPERTARQFLESVFGQRQTPLTREEFKHLILRHRKLVDCLIPGFERVPQDPLHRAAESGEVQQIEHLLDAEQLDVDGRDGLGFPTTPLHLASRYGHASAVEALLKRGANPRMLSAEGQSALHLAIENGRMDVVRMLVGWVDLLLPNEEGQTVFHTAAYHGAYKPLRAIMPYLEVSSICELKDNKGRTPVHTAVMCDCWMALDIFVEAGKLNDADLAGNDALDADGQSPLHVAASHRALRCARKLVAMSASLAAIDYHGRTVAACAASVPDNDSMLTLVLSTGVIDVNLSDEDGNTALNTAMKTKDPRMLRVLLNAGADPNIPEQGSGYTPLHKAAISNWLDGVDAILGNGVQCKIMYDADGYTPLDYARSAEIFELLRDYVMSMHPTYDDDHPIDFQYGMVFDEGSWELVQNASVAGTRVLKRKKVSKEVAQKRSEHKMIDKDSIIRALRRSGLVVVEETVRIQMKYAGFIKGPIKQYAFVRIGAPLYRLQQEAMRMRLQVKRTDFDKYEDYYVDQQSYPNTGFVALSVGQKQKLVLNIIQSQPSSEMQFTASMGRTSDPLTAGISIAYYKKYEVISDVMVLHHPKARGSLMRFWGLQALATKAYWQQQMLDFFTSSKRNAFRPLEMTREYFGLKTAFYFGFVTFYTNFLISPAIAGVIAFGIEFIPSEYESQIADDEESAAKFNSQYDHPMMFVYGAMLCGWMAHLVCAWRAKEAELAYKWGVENLKAQVPTPNPYSTADIRLQFLGGSWVYRATLTPAQKKQQRTFISTCTAPIMVLLIACVVGWIILGNWVLDKVVNERDLHEYFDDPIKKDRNLYGTLALYSTTAMMATFVWLLNTIFQSVSMWLTYNENHESLQAYEFHLALRSIIFGAINNYSALFYLQYYRNDIDMTASLMASLMVVQQLLGNLTEYIIPWMEGRKPAAALEKVRQAKAARRAKADEKRKAKQAEKEKRALLKGLKEEGVEDADEEQGMIDVSSAATILANKEGIDADGSTFQKTDKRAEDAVALADVEETWSSARDEILGDEPALALEFAELVIQFGHIALFGATWPLASLACLISNFMEVRLDMWKFCSFVRRPVAQVENSIGRLWNSSLIVLSLCGIINHCFLCCVCSKTMDEYFFPGISMWERLVAAFCAQNFFLAVYFCLALWTSSKPVAWATTNKEPLRFIRDAYRAGCALRERRYRMLLADPSVTPSDVCVAEDIDGAAADRYLRCLRFVESVPPAERRAMLLDSSSTIQSLASTVLLKVRGGVWEDPGEKATAAGLLGILVPVTSLKQAYVLGKQVREASYRIWEEHQDVVIMGSTAATIMSIRQFACIECDCTMPQAERYCRLVRFIDRSGGNPWERIAQLAGAHPQGLMSVLQAVAEREGDDDGEPVPSELGTLVEPVSSAQNAFERADVVRRRMYEHWVSRHNKTALHHELVQEVCEAFGAFPAQLERYLLIKRYCDSLPERQRTDLLSLQRAQTLELCGQIREQIRNGQWRDPGEPSFVTHVPPIVIEDPTTTFAAEAGPSDQADITLEA